MAFDNSEIRFEGYIGQDVSEMKTDRNGKKYCRFSVGVVTSKHQTLWYQVNVYGEKAEALITKERIKKGLECAVRGTLTVGTYFDRKTVQHKPSIQVWANSVFIQEKLLTKKQKEELEIANKIDQKVSDETVEDLEALF